MVGQVVEGGRPRREHVLDVALHQLRPLTGRLGGALRGQVTQREDRTAVGDELVADRAHPDAGSGQCRRHELVQASYLQRRQREVGVTRGPASTS